MVDDITIVVAFLNVGASAPNRNKNGISAEIEMQCGVIPAVVGKSNY